MISYDQIKDKLRPFDLIAFRGGGLYSSLIAKLEEFEVGVGTFTHVGIVVTSDILPNKSLEQGRLYLFESTLTYNSAPDVLTGKGVLGVQLRDLETALTHYIEDQGTKVAWCPLLNNPYNINDTNTHLRRKLLREFFTDFFRRYNTRLYEVDPTELLAAMFPSLRIIRTVRNELISALCAILHKFGLSENNKDSPGWQFCSELVTEVYQTIGVVSYEFNPEDVLPVDFFGCDRDGLPRLVDTPVYFIK